MNPVTPPPTSQELHNNSEGRLIGGPLGQSRSVRWAIIGGAAVMVVISLVLLYLLTVASSNRDLYETSYTRLFALNIAVAAGLLVLISWAALRLLMRLRQGQFGSKLLIKLALIFGLVGFLPGLVIYVVSYQFVSRSIESWFDVKVENALNAGLSLGTNTLDVLTDDLTNKTRLAAASLGDQSDVLAGLALERVKDQLGIDDIQLWSGTGILIASNGASRFQLSPERPSAQLLRSLKLKKVVAQVEDLDESLSPKAGKPRARIKVLALVPNAGFGLTAEPRILQLVQYLSPVLVENAIAVTTANREYHERALARDGLRRMYIGTLTLTLFLSVLGAMLIAMLLGSQLARPLLLLADGVRQVAAGDLRPKAVLQGKDELDGLTRSFAAMTHQIEEAQKAQTRSAAQINQEREKLQTLLDNLSSGVLVINEQGLVVSSNPAAATILRLNSQGLVGLQFDAIAQQDSLAAIVKQQFGLYERQNGSSHVSYWQQPVTLQMGPEQSGLIGHRQEVHLIVRGAVLPGNADAELKLLVFDDITDVVSAQRSLAWGEVARRLAHEIKNPLTPIQLSAQRLERRLSGKLEEADDAVLHKSVATIVTQVDAMKNLVNEFREYARLPVAQLQMLDLNALIKDVCHLYEDEHGLVPGAVRTTVHMQLDERCPQVPGDPGQLRQVIHNLLQNAQDAVGDESAPALTVSTQYFPGTGHVRLSVVDNGPGFADHVLSRAVEPYVTTKAHGTGLGLAVVKKIADEHGAKLDMSNRMQDGAIIGAQVSLVFSVLGTDEGATAGALPVQTA
jgi:nitrogen fixation/metabolism regulation signal transduction histidine kinase